MYRNLLPSLQQDTAALLRVADAHHRLLSAARVEFTTLNEDGSSSGPHPLVIDKPVEWKQFDHCAVILRLYALYEKFVDDLVGQWLGRLPLLTPRYTDLPEEVRKQHRVGIAHLLNRLGSPQSASLSEVDIVEGMYHGCRGVDAYSLPKEVFLTESRNYTWEVLIALFRAAGVSNLETRIGRSPQLLDFIAQRLNNNETAASQINLLVSLRNTAAHDEVLQTLSTGELTVLSEFVVCLCTALAEAVEDEEIRITIRAGGLIECGQVVNRFHDRIVGVRSRSHLWRVGMTVALKYHEVFRYAQIESIQVDHRAYEELNVSDGDCVAMRLTAGVSSRSKVFAPSDRTSSPDYQV